MSELPLDGEGHQPRDPVVLGNRHHHHGPADDDILIHDDEHCPGDIIYVGEYNDDDDFYLVQYGPADHDHDDGGRQ